MKGKLGLMYIVGVAVWACSSGDATAVPTGDKGTVVELDSLKSKTPGDWKEEKPSSSLRKSQFRLPKVDGDPGDAELAIFEFDKASGGVDANLERWKKKFTTVDGKAVDKSKVDRFKVSNFPVTYLDISGTYLFQPPKSDKYEKRADHRMLGVILEGANHTYFLTLIGPARTVEQHKKGFDDWLKNFK
jgi:hypothetical protein